MLREWSGTVVPRCVSWMFDSALWSLPGDSVRPRIALTFDDGPEPGVTERLLAVLARHRVPATFFMLGRNVRRHPELVRRVADAGHVIGNHSDKHIDGWRVRTPDLLADFDRGADALAGILGHPPYWMRPPYGHFTLPLIAWCRRQRQRMVMWDVAPPDYREGVSPRAVRQALDEWLRPGSIVLLHDNAAAGAVTPTLLDDYLPRLRDAGWDFASRPGSELTAPSWRAAA